MGRLIVSPSLLSADFSALGDAANLIKESCADWIHVDVMDGHFVPVITLGHKLVSDLKKKVTLPLDVHLMILHPERQIEYFCRAGADCLTLHYEGNIHHNRLMQQIRDTGCRCGISIVPSTPVNVLEEILPLVDLVLVMSVNPGFGGQKFMESSYKKIEALSELKKQYDYGFKISVDGGINRLNAVRVVESGADILVTGSAFFAEPNPGDFIRFLKSMPDNGTGGK